MLNLYKGGELLGTFYTINVTRGGFFEEAGVGGHIVKIANTDLLWIESDFQDEVAPFEITIGVDGSSVANAMTQIATIRSYFDEATSIEQTESGMWRALQGNTDNVVDWEPKPIYHKVLCKWLAKFTLNPLYGRWTTVQAETDDAYLLARDYIKGYDDSTVLEPLRFLLSDGAPMLTSDGKPMLRSG